MFSHANELKIEATISSAIVHHNDKKIEFRDTHGSTRVVKCNYDMTRLLRLGHMPLLKQHYPSASTNSATVPKGRYMEGRSGIGETELLSTMMQGMNLLAALSLKAAGDV